ncbi:hypothetical protein EV424DRAFT_1624410 [Suillus variegatus]|nr:hypothetical protein EV424DRAFT_1624410 [Suillus variegatus]
MAKGAARNFSTRPNEKQHGPIKRWYLWQTNRKDLLISRIECLDEERRKLMLSQEELEDTDLDDEKFEEHFHIGSPLKNQTTLSQVEEENKSIRAFHQFRKTRNISQPFPSLSQHTTAGRNNVVETFSTRPEYPPSSSNSQLLKARFPTAWGSSGHRLFVSAFMLASKVICDNTYSNKSWSIVAQGMFQLREINQMERKMYQYLEWELNVDLVTLREFEDMVKKDFAGQGPYLTYILPSSSKTTPPPTTNPFPPPPAALAPMPSYGHWYPSPTAPNSNP